MNASTAPTIGLALSGGGDRAALYDAAIVNVLDGRNASSVANGLGGILQATTYISALSGGSWFLGSLATGDFPEVYPLVLGDGAKGDKEGGEGWLLEYDLTAPGTAAQSEAYLTGIFDDIAGKAEAGFPVTIGDVWARDISRHFAPGTTAANFLTDSPSFSHAANVTFSSVTQLGSYKTHMMPFPLIVVNAVSPSFQNGTYFDGAVVPLENVVYEFSPVEFGSFDPHLARFVPTGALGTALSGGKVVGGRRAHGFDNAGWVMGCSSNLFHEYNVTYPALWNSTIGPTVDLINATFGAGQPGQELDVSAVANPFHGIKSEWKGRTYPDVDESQLRLVDGGLDDEVVPLAPLAVPARGLDLIIIADATADSTTQQPTGGSIAATAARISLFPSKSFNLPPLPKTSDTFIAQGLNTRPTFFGCHATPAKLGGKPVTKAAHPLVVYMPNYDPTGVTNTSTLQTSYQRNQTVAFLDAAVQVGTNGILTEGGKADGEWATCMACAVVERARGKAGVDRTEACGHCFERYCWNGVEAMVGNATVVKRGGGGRVHSRDFVAE